MLGKRALFVYLCMVLVTIGCAGLYLAQFVPEAFYSRYAILQRVVAPFVNTELRAQDVVAQHGRLTPANPKLIFLAIDNASVSLDPEIDPEDFFGTKEISSPESRAIHLMAGGFPWSRSVYALVLDRLVAAGAKAVVFDLNFPKAAAGDHEFAEALERHKDKVVIGSNYVETIRDGVDRPVLAHSAPTDGLLQRGAPGGDVDFHSGGMDDRVGYVNFWASADSVVREAQFTLTDGQLNSYRDEPGAERRFHLSSCAVRKFGKPELVPSDSEPRLLRLTGFPHRGFPPRSLYEIFVPHLWAQNFRGGELVKDSIVVVGAAGNWQHDFHATAFGQMPGPELQLNAINALLHQSFVHQLSPLSCLAVIVVAGLCALLLAMACARPILRLVLLIATSALWFWGVQMLYDHADVAVPLVLPLLALNLNGAAALIHDVVASRSERRRLRRTLERYVSHNVVREMIDKPGAYMDALGGLVKPATILFSDIRNFSKASAHTDTQLLVAQLNEYLTAMVDCVFRYGGTLDKFIGDAVMAVWGNARSDGPAADAKQAVRCAIAMREELRELNERWKAHGQTPLEVGIALNHGDVIVGNIGSPQRMEFTVIGDAVNVSWRLQERTKVHGCELLLGEKMGPLVAPEFVTEPLGVAQVTEGVIARYSRLVPPANVAAAVGSVRAARASVRGRPQLLPA